ncbi:MAG: ABC transporter substrate-binding protein [Rhizomicrobium sp.]
MGLRVSTIVAAVMAVLLVAPGVSAADLPLNAPLPDKVPPGTTLVVGGPTLETAFRLSGELQRLPFKVVFTTFSGGPAVLDAFRANALDVGLGNDIPAIHETFIGFDVRIVAVAGRRGGTSGVSFGIAPGANIRTPADLRGKRIAYSAGQAQGSVVLRTLSRYGIAKDQVTLVPLPSRNDVYVNALKSHLVDAAPLGATVFTKHYIDDFGRDGARILTPAGVPENPINLWVRTDTLKDPAKAAALKLYLQAYIRAQHWVDTHREQWIDAYYIKNQGLSHADADYLVSSTGAFVFLANWDQAIRDEQETINFMARETGQKPFDARTIFDRRFESVAAQALGAKIGK